MKAIRFTKGNATEVGIKSCSLTVMGRLAFGYYYRNRFGWVRLLGIGVKWKDITIHPLIFSERYGYSKALTIGKWRIGILK